MLTEFLEIKTDPESPTTQSESETRVVNLNEDHSDSIQANNEETDEGNPHM